MIKNARTGPRAAIGLLLAAYLQGCAVVGGMLPSKNQVFIDEHTVDSEFKMALTTASRLTFMTKDQTGAHMADYLEANSNYQVSLVPPPEAASPSQARRHMSQVCGGAENPDLVLTFRTPTSNAGTGTTLTGAFIGRAMFNIEQITEVLRCDTGGRSTFTASGSINQGVYNADQTKTNQVLGQAFGHALLRLAGKAHP